MSEGKVYKAKAAFWYHDDEEGIPKFVAAGARAREGHPVLDGGRREFFVEDKVDFEVEEVPEEAPRRRGPGRPPKRAV